MDWLDLLGTGVYSIPEAAKLSGVSADRIGRWVRGDASSSAATTRKSPRVWAPDLPAEQGVVALSFRDLMEIRFIDSYLKHGLKWKTIRIAAQNAAQILESSHPFSTRRFKTDGASIFAEIAERSGERSLLDLVRRQYAIAEILDPHLFESLEFASDDGVSRWFPLWPNRRVVVDPTRSFGQPVVAASGVPTFVLAKAVRAEGSVLRVSKLFDVDPKGIEAAVELERRLAA